MALLVGPSVGYNNIRRFLENPRASINVVLDALANEGSDLANLLSHAALSNPSSAPFVESLGIGPEDVAVPPIVPSLREKGDVAREELGPASFLLDLAAPSLMDLAGPVGLAAAIPAATLRRTRSPQELLDLMRQHAGDPEALRQLAPIAKRMGMEDLLRRVIEEDAPVPLAPSSSRTPMQLGEREARRVATPEFVEGQPAFPATWGRTAGRLARWIAANSNLRPAVRGSQGNIMVLNSEQIGELLDGTAIPTGELGFVDESGNFVPDLDDPGALFGPPEPGTSENPARALDPRTRMDDPFRVAAESPPRIASGRSSEAIVLGRQPLRPIEIHELATRLGIPEVSRIAPPVVTESGRKIGQPLDLQLEGSLGVSRRPQMGLEDIFARVSRLQYRLQEDTFARVSGLRYRLQLDSPAALQKFLDSHWPGLFRVDDIGLIRNPRAQRIVVAKHAPPELRGLVLSHESAHSIFGMRDKEATLRIAKQMAKSQGVNIDFDKVLQEAEGLAREISPTIWDFIDKAERYLSDDPGAPAIVELAVNSEGNLADYVAEIAGTRNFNLSNFGDAVLREHVKLWKSEPELLAEGLSSFIAYDPEAAAEKAPEFTKLMREIVIGGDPEMKRRGIEWTSAGMLPLVGAGLASITGQAPGALMQPVQPPVEEQLFGQ